MKNINTKARQLKEVKETTPEEEQERNIWKAAKLSKEEKQRIYTAYKIWLEKEDSLQMTEWLWPNDYSEEFWEVLCQRDKAIGDLDKKGRKLLGARREKRMWDFKMATNVGLLTQRYYHTDFMRAYNEKVALDKEIASKETNIRFLPVLPSVSDTGVPVKAITNEEV